MILNFIFSYPLHHQSSYRDLEWKMMALLVIERAILLLKIFNSYFTLIIDNFFTQKKRKKKEIISPQNWIYKFSRAKFLRTFWPRKWNSFFTIGISYICEVQRRALFLLPISELLRIQRHDLRPCHVEPFGGLSD